MGKATAGIMCVSAQSIEAPHEIHQLSLQSNVKTSFFWQHQSVFPWTEGVILSSTEVSVKDPLVSLGPGSKAALSLSVSHLEWNGSLNNDLCVSAFRDLLYLSVHLQGTGTAHHQLATLCLVDPLLPSKTQSSMEITLLLETRSLTRVRKGM